MRRLVSLATTTIVCVATLAAGGCITLSDPPEPVRYYTLADPNQATVTGSGPGVLAGPFELPEYLNRPQLVTLGSNNELLLAPAERWAEPLEDSVARRVAGQLRVTLNQQQVYAYPSLTVRDVQQRVTGAISHFGRAADGRVQLELTWGVLDDDGNYVYGPVFATYSDQLEAGADTGAMVGAMGALLDRYAADAAAALGTGQP